MKIILDEVIRLVQSRGGITTWWDSLIPSLAEQVDFDITRPRKFLKYAPAFIKCDVFFSSYYRINLFPGCKNVLVVHDVLREKYIPGLRSALWAFYMRLCVRFANKVVFISESTKRSFVDFYGVPPCDSMVIHHGFHFTELKTCRNKKFDFIFIGKRDHYKNFSGGLRCIANSSLAIVGSGLSQKEKQTLDDFGVSWQCFGFVDEDHLVSLLRESRYLYWPSLDEGFGMPLIEAISNGCLPICLDNDINREILGEHMLVLESWRKDSDDVEVEDAYDSVQKRFGHGAMVKKYVELLKD